MLLGLQSPEALTGVGRCDFKVAHSQVAKSVLVTDRLLQFYPMWASP